jgi:hypothetical protein
VSDSAASGRLTKRDVGTWLLVLVGGTTAVGGAVGWLASDGQRYDWGTAATAATAFGTIALAAFTGALAWTTNADVTATRELAELTRADQRARETPILYPVEIIIPSDATIRSVHDHRGHITSTGFNAVARIQNVGPGPAVSIELTMTYSGDLTLSGRHVQHGVISTLLYSDIWDVTFWWETTEPELRGSAFSDRDFELEGHCWDASGRSHSLRHGTVGQPRPAS